MHKECTKAGSKFPGRCTDVVPSWISICGSRLGGPGLSRIRNWGPSFRSKRTTCQQPTPSLTHPKHLDPSTSPLNGLRISHPSCPPVHRLVLSQSPSPFSLLPNQKVLKSVAVRTIRQSHRARERAISDMYGLLCPSACVCLIHPLDLAIVDQVLFRSHSSNGDLFPYRAAGGYNMYNPHTHTHHAHTPNGDS